jgi:AraC-like DNA-binding protein
MHDTRPSPAGPLQQRLGARTPASPPLRLAPSDAPERERLLQLRTFFEQLGMRYDAVPLGRDPIAIEVALHGLPGIQFLSGRLQGVRYQRTRMSNDPTEDVGLVLNPGGTNFISQLGREIELGAGEGTIVSLSDPLISAHRPPAGLRVLRIPRAQLAPRLARGQGGFLHRIPQGTAALGLLTGYVNVALQEAASADRDLQHLLASHLHDLIAVAIGATRDATHAALSGGLRAARLDAIKRDIGRSLDRSDLSVSTIAARHGCTERLVQRWFEAEGTTFTEYVLAQRLALAHGMLADPRLDGAKISAVAYDCGFADISYFNRVFRRSYGAAPSDIREQAREARDGVVPTSRRGR